VVNVVETREGEWAFAVFGLICCAVLALVTLAGWGLDERFHHETSRIDLTRRCLTRERGLAIESGIRDPLAASASRGWLATTVEGNRVHISIAGSDKEAARIASGYQAVAEALVGRLELRGSHVYLWDRPASPTQRQALYDCEY
jgi:hypothetical protein